MPPIDILKFCPLIAPIILDILKSSVNHSNFTNITKSLIAAWTLRIETDAVSAHLIVHDFKSYAVPVASSVSVSDGGPRLCGECCQTVTVLGDTEHSHRGGVFISLPNFVLRFGAVLNTFKPDDNVRQLPLVFLFIGKSRVGNAFAHESANKIVVTECLPKEFVCYKSHRFVVKSGAGGLSPPPTPRTMKYARFKNPFLKHRKRTVWSRGR